MASLTELDINIYCFKCGAMNVMKLSDTFGKKYIICKDCHNKIELVSSKKKKSNPE